jgi:CRISPR-associated protein Cmr2
LVKRLWHLSYLKEKWGLPTAPDQFRMPNTHKIAAHLPNESGDDEDEDKLPGEKYYAVLALDGDEIGKWVSGEKTPALADQVSSYPDAAGHQPQGALPYFKVHGGAELLATKRPLTPSYHLQFSQALSNFALLCARRVVEAHDGRLIYAGGDDVLAMLPADSALACAADLREAFQGRAVSKAGISSPAHGYLSVHDDQAGNPIAFLVPGPKAEVSVGVAIAHFKAPLQDVVRTAQAAEKRAKKQLGRAALAVTVLKRSGEITEWGARWSSGGLNLYHGIGQRLQSGGLSARFPHRICQLLEPYRNHLTMGSHLLNASDFNAAEIIQQEFRFALNRQSQAGKARDNQAELEPLLMEYLECLAAAKPPEDDEPEALLHASSGIPQRQLQAVDGLCTVVAFSHRTRNETAEGQSA